MFRIGGGGRNMTKSLPKRTGNGAFIFKAGVGINLEKEMPETPCNTRLYTIFHAYMQIHCDKVVIPFICCHRLMLEWDTHNSWKLKTSQFMRGLCVTRRDSLSLSWSVCTDRHHNDILHRLQSISWSTLCKASVTLHEENVVTQNMHFFFPFFQSHILLPNKCFFFFNCTFKAAFKGTSLWEFLVDFMWW